ncbi:MAG: glycogen debranching protein GlgX [Proteobacteria bacterium]|nr:glycogen debranching protein GlgX [Pseudomonadota bacterium]
MPWTTQRLLPGASYPLGAHWDGLGVNFAVFSAHAQRIELCLFDTTGRREVRRVELPEYTDEVFHGYLPQARPGLLYGYRAYGPYQPEAGHRFNPNKLLLDPYARQLAGSLNWSDALFGYHVGSPREDLSFDRRDSANFMPKAVVVDDVFRWGNDSPPRRLWEETVIYELHVRGLTHLHPEVPVSERGTFAGLSHPRVIEHLVRLGVTAVELLPVHTFLQDRFLLQRGLRNYWGYSTLGFFAPEPSYLSGPEKSPHEIRETIRKLHEAGIEVILDVVYNHTCEGSEMGPTLSWRGLDSHSYYNSVRGSPRRLVNDTGCGNTLNTAHPRVLQMVMDSLRYWVEAYHVDGFRFDLGTTLGREHYGFDSNGGFFDAIRQDPVLARVKLISEPWDIGPGGYQLGNHPPGFAEWNDQYRDTLRRYWRGEPGQRAAFAGKLMGSSEIFEKRRRKAWASVNYITSHDGFTVHDLVTYAERHNEANQENSQDGHGENFSANYGVEGETDDEAVLDIRAALKRAMLASLFLSHGTPMLQAGDEFCRTQHGNNNAYCQDNEISWVDWSGILADAPNEARRLTAFTRSAIGLRARHASLHTSRFLHGKEEVLPGIHEAAWFDEAGKPLGAEDWAYAAAHMFSLRRAVQVDSEVDLTIAMFNAAEEARDFMIPGPELDWVLVLDSARPELVEETLEGGKVRVGARSVVLLATSVPT